MAATEGQLGRGAGLALKARSEALARPATVGAESAFTKWVVIAGLAIAMIPAFLAALTSITNPFLHPTIAFSTRFLGESHAPLDSWPISVTPASPLFIMALSQVTSLAPKVIQYLPLVSPLFVLAYYALAKRLFRNPLVAVALTIALAYTFSEAHYAVWRHSFGLLGILLLALVLLRMLERGARWPLLIVAMLVFFGTRFFSYSLEMSMIALTIGAAGYAWLAHRRVVPRWLAGLSLLWVVAYFTFNPVWEHQLIIQLDLRSANLAWVGLVEFFNQRLAILPGLSPAPKEELAFVAHFGSPLHVTLLQIAYMLLIIAPLAVFASASLGSLVLKPLGRLARPQRSGWMVLWWGLVVTGLAEVLVYMVAGTVTVRPLLFYGPVMALLALRALAPRLPVLLVYASLLGFLSISSYFAVLPQRETFYPLSLTRHQGVEASAEWFIDHVPEERWVVDWEHESTSRPLGSRDGIFYQSGPYVDHQIGGMFMVKAAEKGKPFVQRLWTHDLYRNLVTEERWNLPDFWGTEAERLTGVYAVINANRYGSTMIRSFGWLDLAPMSAYLPTLRENWNFNKIYDDDVVWIVRSRD